MENFENDRKSFLAEILNETPDCSEIDIVIALQNSLRTYDDVCLLLNSYDEWSVDYEMATTLEDRSETFFDKLHNQTYSVGEDLDLYIGTRLIEVRYIGMMPAHEGVTSVAKGTVLPTFWAKDGTSILYLTDNEHDKLDFSIILLSKSKRK